MRIDQLGELARDERIREWLVSAPVEVPLFGVPLQFVLEDLERDPFPEEFSAAVANFLTLTPADRASAAPHVDRNYHRYIEATGGQDVDLQIDSKEDLWKHVHPTGVHVSRRSRRDQKVYVQLLAECDWEVEHGLQLVYREGHRLTRVSDQDGHLTHADAYDLPEGDDRIS